MKDRAVCDSSPIIVFQRIGRLDILAGLSAELLIPPAVESETGAGPPTFSVRQIANVALAQKLASRLDPGEAQAIALAVSEKVDYLVIDELKGRREATALGVPVVGTFGVLLRAKKIGLLARIEPVVAAMDRAGMHATPSLRASVLRLAGE